MATFFYVPLICLWILIFPFLTFKSKFFFLLLLYLNAWQPRKVLNELNARQSNIFREFPLKDILNLLMVFDLSLQIPGNSKNYVGLQDGKITELVCTIKLACS